MLKIGLRVVRGRDWKWKDQDGGEGHVGTVVAISKPSNARNKLPDKTVSVQWDYGAKYNYRIGFGNAYDLLVFDNAGAGVRHVDIICNGCKSPGIMGIRWKCSRCSDYNLCTQCYMSDVHNLKHAFQRFLTSNSTGIQLTARANCTKIPLKGIFTEAKVIRGPDWQWSDQDGGAGNTGRVISINNVNNDRSRTTANVVWSTGLTNIYRLGYKGCFDVIYVDGARAGTYFKEHLPLLGQPTSSSTVNDVPAPMIENVMNPALIQLGREVFCVGDKVKILMNIDTLKGIQEGHVVWNPRMADCIGKIGTVHRITNKGYVRVQYKGCSNHKWTFHPIALTKVNSRENFTLGDTIIVIIIFVIVQSYRPTSQ